MPTYEQEIQVINPLSFDAIRRVSLERLPVQFRNCAWTYPGLERGTALLHTDEQACAYIVAYGKAHREKVEKAFENFPFQYLQQGYEIIDWACGQGLASVCFLDLLRKVGRVLVPRKITLIEPSDFTLNRASVSFFCGERSVFSPTCSVLLEIPMTATRVFG